MTYYMERFYLSTSQRVQSSNKPLQQEIITIFRETMTNDHSMQMLRHEDGKLHLIWSA